MLHNQNFIKFTLGILILGFASIAAEAQPQQAYERGLEELYRGNTTRALNTWYEAYQEPGGIDSRIGFEYIRAVTENNLRGYYNQATEMYYQAIMMGTGINSRVALRQEIERIQPIIGEGIYRQWTTWWDEQNSDLQTDMRGYWIQVDPTPSDVANERLMEHWTRIATARNRFTKNGSTVYGTDERALIYIRYGEPDRSQTGILTLQSFSIMPWLENQLLRSVSGEDSPNGDMMPMPTRELDDLNRIEDVIYEFHQYPEYEIWFYDRLTPERGENVPIIFGTDTQTGEFALQKSVSSFIPERAFYPERQRDDQQLEFTRAGITPALILQLIYYEQLVQVDSFFENRLQALQDQVLEQGMDALQGMDLTFKAETSSLLAQQLARAPRQKSTYRSQIPEIPLGVHQYRFLNEQNEPEIITYVESEPREAFLIDYYRNRNRSELETDFGNGANASELFSFYELEHTLQVYDEKWNVVRSLSDMPELIIRRSSADESILSMFRFNQENKDNQSVSVKLMNYDPDTETVYDTPFPESLRGLNSLQFRQPEPLVSHSDSLEVADLVLGYEREGWETEPFSFHVANNQTIPFRETLYLHYEVYNLAWQPNGFTRFELTYRILPVEENGKIRTDETEFILTLNFTNEYQRVVEDLEIETTNLTPGLYDLRVFVVDTVTGQEKERTIRFEVVE
ncbi:MAG: GWxTD domain-containing protein [Balneolaceae bacterium]